MSDENAQETPSFMKSMFMGEIAESMIFPYPKVASETSEAVRMILDATDKFAKDNVKAAEWDEKGAMPIEVVKAFAEMGLMGLAVPEEMGGLGLPQSAYVRILQRISEIDGALATTLGAHQSIGYKALLLFGTAEQKKKFLPRLASGQLIAAYCLTEPGSGSDAASIKTKAKLSPDGRHYLISGSKIWITNGGIASFMTVFAKTEVGPDKQEKVTCFALELPAEGVSVGPSEHKLGIRASWTNAVHFDNVKVPVENVIGGVGYGFKVAMGVLNHGRLGLAGGCVGIGRICLKASIEHANERVQFKKKLREFGMIQEKIGRMSVNLFAAESMVYMTTSFIDRGNIDYSLEGAIVKVFASEMAWEAVDENLQIWAGNGYMREYPYERWFRNARINRIFEGANEILRAFIALSGMQGQGKMLSDLASAIKEPLQGLGLVTDFAVRKFKQNIFGQSITMAHPHLKKIAGMIEEYSVELAAQVEVVLRRHGREVHTKQFAQKRLADVAIDLYAMSCILSRVTQMLEAAGGDVQKCELELALANVFFAKANLRIRSNFSQMDKNDDEQVKFVANTLCDRGEYPFDAVL